jgi:hypothetical protein
MLPLEFDGRTDSIYRPIDKAGNRHLEYVAMHGAFDDVPLPKILDVFAVPYPRMLLTGIAEDAGDFMADVSNERTVGTR